MAKLYKADGSKAVEIQPANGTDFQLEELQKAVGGYIEIINLGNGMILVVDEEGLCKHKPINLKASFLAGHGVVGDVVYCKSEEVK